MSYWRYKATGNTFYLYDLPYIGLSLCLGYILNAFLPRNQRQIGRKVTQLLIGCYMLFFIGFKIKVNMQIEGFFFYLFLGIFGGATLHYSIAKLFGTLILNRGWCGWACWTAMILDFLPFKNNNSGRIKYLGIVRYIHFGLILLIVSFLFFYKGYYPKSNTIQIVYWLTIGNLIYYITGILLAFILKDNRAFCKYLCPIPTTQKILSRFSLFKFKVDNDLCIGCKVCEKNCPMDIKILEYAKENKRTLSTECILCAVCSDSCSKEAIKFTINFDFAIKEKIKFKN